MPKPSLRTRSKKRLRIRLPGGRAKTGYRRKKIGVSRCSRCGHVLSGVPHLGSSRLHKLPANQRRPQRMFGGQLCHVCLQELLKLSIRGA